MTGEGRERDHGASAGTGLTPVPVAEQPPHDPVAPRLEAPQAPADADRRSTGELAAFILAEAGPPIDVWAIAALLESFGIRDRDALERYGQSDVFALAAAVQAHLPEAPPSGRAAPPPRAALHKRVTRFARIYGRGTFFFVPLALQLAALLIVGVSQFAAIDFTTRQASVVAVAAALSFVVTAGFAQALGYLAPLYIDSDKHLLAERVSWAVVGLGTAAALVVGAVAWAVVSATGGYSGDDMRIAAGYYALLCAQGLSGALLYMLHRFTLIVVATVAALAVAGVLYERTSLPVEQVHWLALAAGVAIQLALAALLLRRRARSTEGDLRLARLPRAGLLARRALPFALYGLLYFAFLTADRAVAWASGENPLPLWFHPHYELGLDWALGGIVFALAFLEVTVENFSRMLVPTAQRFGVDAVREHNRAISRFWARQLAFVSALAAVGTWLAVVVAVALHELGALGPAEQIYSDPVTRYVFGLGLIGYALLALGIANSVFVMSLSRPWRAVLSIAPGLVVSIAVGVVATTHYAHWTAVFGMVAGAGVFAVLSCWQAWRTLRRSDYYGYAAY